MRWVDQPRQRTHGVGRCAVLLEEVTEDVSGDVLAFLGDVCLDADVEVGGMCAAGEVVEEVGEPEERGLVWDDPVEVYMRYWVRSMGGISEVEGVPLRLCSGEELKDTGREARRSFVHR